jgi:hypothetical protein
MNLKDGWKTSEFWMAVAGFVVGLVAPHLSESQAATGEHWFGVVGLVCAIVSATAYVVSRGLAKKGQS